MAKTNKTTIDVDHVSKLASLSLTSKEKSAFQIQLEEVVAYISKLNSLNTQNIEPIGQITGLENIAREDTTLPSLTQEAALSNAPKTHNGFIEVDAIFEGE